MFYKKCRQSKIENKMSGINDIVDLIKQMRRKIIEYVSNDCCGCDETAQSLRDHIYFATPWYVHCSDYWTRLLNHFELIRSQKKKYLNILLFLQISIQLR
jgi:hypothetical protein